MCGIFSIFSTNDSLINQSMLEQGLDTLYHRGPNQKNYWLSDKKNIALGHTRLSIIDLETGQQPLSNGDNSIYLVANGEFYDFENIKQDLEKKGHHFKTKSDSEIALNLYYEYGTACLNYLRGEFAFTLWDQNNQTLFAARDRLGIKPLYYAKHQGKLYISSEIKAIIAAGVPAVWDQEAYLQRSFFFQNQSLFKGISQVPPGHFLLATRNNFKLVKYWDFNYSCDSELIDAPEKDLIHRLRSELLDATKLRLRADVPVGVYLSGGIDSSAVLGMVSHIKQEPIDAFTLSFSHQDYDESTTAKLMANKVKANHHIIPVTQESLADNFSQAIWHSETLCMNAHSIAKFMLSKAVKELGFKVVLTGEGADEVFAGYSSFRNDLINTSTLIQNPNDLLNQLKETNKTSSGLLISNTVTEGVDFIKRYLGFEPVWLLPLAQIFTSLKALFNTKTLKHLGNSHPIQHFLHQLDFNQINHINPVHSSMYMLSKSALPNYVLTNLGDRMEMANSLEGRVPFLDHKVIELATKIPVTFKIKDMKEKHILREAVKPFVIDQVYQKEKHPFLAPPSVITPGEKLHELVQDSLRSDLMDAIPFFDKKAIATFLDEAVKQPPEQWPSTEAILLEILSLYFLQKHFNLSAKA